MTQNNNLKYGLPTIQHVEHDQLLVFCQNRDTDSNIYNDKEKTCQYVMRI